MAVPKESSWSIEPHTKAKHDILRRYLAAWFPILGKYNNIFYIDGFAGAGRYEGGEKGSPIIALEEAMKYKTIVGDKQLYFLFIDEHSGRVKNLITELDNLLIPDNFHIDTKTGTFEKVFKHLLDSIEEKRRKLVPTFAFIDPFGFKGLPFELMKRLLVNHNSTELFINFSVNSVNRFVEETNVNQHIVDLFGTIDVLDIVRKSNNRVTDLRSLYQRQLKTVAKFVRYFEMRGENNRVIFYLFFATNHPLGLKKMKEAFWKVDSDSGFQFSDATDPNQPTLFDVDPSDELSKAIYTHFSNKMVLVEDIEKFVINDTPFISKHMRKALRQLEEKEKIKVDKYKSDGKKRRKGSFPVGTQINFVPTLSFF